MTLAEAVAAIHKLQEQVATLKTAMRPLLADFEVQQAQIERRIEAAGGDEALLPRRVQERRAAVEAAQRSESGQESR